MTHFYTLLLGGTVVTGGDEPDVTAIAWAEDTILALGSDDDVRAVYELHGNCYVVKPIDLDRFIDAVRAIDTFWLHTARLPVVRGN